MKSKVMKRTCDYGAGKKAQKIESDEEKPVTMAQAKKETESDEENLGLRQR